MNSNVTLYNFTTINTTNNSEVASVDSDVSDIILLQLEEDGLAEEYFDEIKEENGCWRWLPVAYTIKEIAIEVRMTTPVGYAWAFAEGNLGRVYDRAAKAVDWDVWDYLTA